MRMFVAYLVVLITLGKCSSTIVWNYAEIFCMASISLVPGSLGILTVCVTISPRRRWRLGTFSAAKTPTPRYNYNQIMYRLDLADPRLDLPAHD